MSLILLGLETAAMLISSSDCVITIGVSDTTLLVANIAGLQVRSLIEVEPDAMALTTRFVSDHSIVGNLNEACTKLAEKCEFLSFKRGKEEKLISSTKSIRRKSIFEDHRHVSPSDKFQYMSHQSVNFNSIKLNASGFRQSLIANEPEKTIDELCDSADDLWDTFHKEKVCCIYLHVMTSYIMIIQFFLHVFSGERSKKSIRMFATIAITVNHWLTLATQLHYSNNFLHCVEMP